MQQYAGTLTDASTLVLTGVTKALEAINLQGIFALSTSTAVVAHFTL